MSGRCRKYPDVGLKISEKRSDITFFGKKLVSRIFEQLRSNCPNIIQKFKFINLKKNPVDKYIKKLPF